MNHVCYPFRVSWRAWGGDGVLVKHYNTAWPVGEIIREKEEAGVASASDFL